MLEIKTTISKKRIKEWCWLVRQRKLHRMYEDLYYLTRGQGTILAMSLAQDGERAIGVAVVSENSEYGLNVYVSPGYRREGLGTKLVRLVLSRVKKEMKLNVHDGDFLSRKLYSKFKRLKG